MPELDSWHNPRCRLRFIILNGISAGWWRGTTHFLIPITTTPGTGHYRLGWSQLNQKNGDKIDRSTACCLLLHTLIVICKLCSKLVLQPAYSREKILSQMWHGDADEKDNRQLNESKANAERGDIKFSFADDLFTSEWWKNVTRCFPECFSAVLGSLISR